MAPKKPASEATIRKAYMRGLKDERHLKHVTYAQFKQTWRQMEAHMRKHPDPGGDITIS